MSSTVHDIAAFVLEQTGTITTYKLQKLLYYVQAHALVWDEKPAFDATIKAYENGPVVTEVFYAHKGLKYVSRWTKGDSSRVADELKETVRAVLEKYGSKAPEELVEMTHAEAPWSDAWSRGGTREISNESIRAYFVKHERAAEGDERATKALSAQLQAFLSSTPLGDS